jgi:hypothetical protein
MLSGTLNDVAGELPFRVNPRVSTAGEAATCGGPATGAAAGAGANEQLLWEGSFVSRPDAMGLVPPVLGAILPEAIAAGKSIVLLRHIAHRLDDMGGGHIDGAIVPVYVAPFASSPSLSFSLSFSCSHAHAATVHAAPPPVPPGTRTRRSRRRATRARSSRRCCVPRATPRRRLHSSRVEPPHRAARRGAPRGVATRTSSPAPLPFATPRARCAQTLPPSHSLSLFFI